MGAFQKQKLKIGALCPPIILRNGHGGKEKASMQPGESVRMIASPTAILSTVWNRVWA